MAIQNASLPQESVILITGVNGLVGSHVADQVLLHGYKVLGTVRNAKKNDWLVEFFRLRYGEGKF
jgi:nucleoside-diphosphate-sugar epimerase